jgi:hypothetical protein
MLRPDQPSEPCPANGLRAQVLHIRKQGHGYQVAIKVANAATLRLLVPAMCGLAPGQELCLAIPPEAVWVFPEQAT